MKRHDAESFLPVVPLESLRGHEDMVQVRRGSGRRVGSSLPCGGCPQCVRGAETAVAGGALLPPQLAQKPNNSPAWP